MHLRRPDRLCRTAIAARGFRAKFVFQFGAVFQFCILAKKAAEFPVSGNRLVDSIPAPRSRKPVRRVEAKETFACERIPQRRRCNRV